MFAEWRHQRALKALRTSEHAVLRSYAEADWPPADTPIEDVALLGLDFELDGLERDAHLLQAGWIEFSTRGIAMAGAVSRDIRSSADLRREAVIVHGIGVERAILGEPVADVIADLVSALEGHFLVAHAAGIEISAINRTTQKLYGTALPMRAICTLTLERHLHPNLAAPDAYRLATCRARYGLPDYRGHDALTDAIAAAELFLAQCTRLGPKLTIGDVLRFAA